MAKYIIGNMTGNSMDAIDLVLTRFDNGNMEDICSYSEPYSADMQRRTEKLRHAVRNKTKNEILQLPDFLPFHNDYIQGIADCINEMCRIHKLDKSQIDAIGFHGKTLDHNPPSKAKSEHSTPFSLQIGSGKMLADLTGIKVIYDFRSDFIMNGFEGAPLVAPHNARIAKIEGDGFYYNGGNTSNFALVLNGIPIISADAGPFNEYIDNFIRRHTDLPFDKDGIIGRKGIVDRELLAYLFATGEAYFSLPLPKSGDPAYYHKEEIFADIERKTFSLHNIVRTFEYFAAYIAAQALTLIPDNIQLPSKFILFGGGWKNPLVRQDFINILEGKSYIPEQHRSIFAKLYQRFTTPLQIINSKFGNFMEARLFADMAYHRLENKPWPLPETKQIIAGQIAEPSSEHRFYDDMLSRAAKK